MSRMNYTNATFKFFINFSVSLFLTVFTRENQFIDILHKIPNFSSLIHVLDIQTMKVKVAPQPVFIVVLWLTHYRQGKRVPREGRKVGRVTGSL